MRNALVVLGILGLLAACGSDDEVPPAPPATQYSATPNTTVTTGPATAPGNGTVTAQTDKSCKSGEHADAIVDSTGKVVRVVCEPIPATPTPIDGQGNIDIGKDNKGVVTIDGSNDGVDVTGDVKSTGQNVTVFGSGADVSVIGGSIDGDGNNFTARGVTVKGNVVINGNDATLLLAVVEGDVIITGNNAVIAQCTVLGKIVIQGNNAVIVGNKVSGGIQSGQQNASCDGNVDATGAAITCSGTTGDGKKK
jgi:hypothetical protein